MACPTLAANGGYPFDPSDPAYQALANDEVRKMIAGCILRDEHGATVAFARVEPAAFGFDAFAAAGGIFAFGTEPIQPVSGVVPE